MSSPVNRRTVLGAAAKTLVGSAAFAVSHASGESGVAVPAPSAKPGVMIRGYAAGPFGQVHFQDGRVGKPLVMIHQAPMSSRQFDSVYPHFLELGYRPIGIDLPGFGMSDPTEFVPTVGDWARVVPAVLDHLGIDRADVVGHHTGALVATEVELQFRPRVRKLVLGGALPLTAVERRKFLEGVERNEIRFVYEADGRHLQHSFMTRHRMYGDSPPPDPRLITRYIVEKFMGRGPFWHGHFAAFSYDHGAALMAIRCQTLLITNTGDQIYEQTKLAHRLRSDFVFVELQGGGVDIVDQQPKEWASRINQFLI